MPSLPTDSTDFLIDHYTIFTSPFIKLLFTLVSHNNSFVASRIIPPIQMFIVITMNQSEGVLTGL